MVLYAQTIIFVLRYAITCHKVQSQTLEWAVGQLDGRSLFNGLDYTMLSRVRGLASIMFLDEEINDLRFNYGDRKFYYLNEKEDERINELAVETAITI